MNGSNRLNRTGITGTDLIFCAALSQLDNYACSHWNPTNSRYLYSPRFLSSGDCNDHLDKVNQILGSFTRKMGSLGQMLPSVCNLCYDLSGKRIFTFGSELAAWLTRKWIIYSSTCRLRECKWTWHGRTSKLPAVQRMQAGETRRFKPRVSRIDIILHGSRRCNKTWLYRCFVVET